MSKVPDENSENGQFSSTSNTVVISENSEKQFPSTSNTVVINENGENGQSPSLSSTLINENGENGQSPSTSNTKVIKAPSKKKLSRKDKLKILLKVGLMLFIEIALPLILYYLLKEHLGDVRALIISGVPPFIVVLYGFIRNRRIDVLGAMMVITSIIGIILTVIKNDARLILIRESVMTGSVGLTFLLTLIPIKIGSFQMRPIIFYFGRDMTTGGTFGASSKKSQLSEEEDILETWDRYWNQYAVFRHGFYVLTIVWGVGLLIEVPARIIIIIKAPTVERAVFWSNIITYSWLGVLILFNTIYSRMFKKRCMKEIPKEEAAASV